MKYFTIAVFAIHTLFEIAFGLNAFISGASSSQTAAEIANQSAQITIATRFLGSALTAIGVGGLLIIIFAGVQSYTAKLAAIGFAVFHTMGAAGILLTSMSHDDALARTVTQGALTVHALLALGFIVIALRLPHSLKA